MWCVTSLGFTDKALLFKWIFNVNGNSCKWGRSPQWLPFCLYHIPAASILLDGHCSWLWPTVQSPKWIQSYQQPYGFAIMFRKAFFCTAEPGILEEENHERSCNRHTVKRLAISFQNKQLVGLAENLKQNSKVKPLSGGIISCAPMYLAPLWPLSPGMASGLTANSRFHQGKRKKKTWRPLLRSPEPAMLTQLPLCQEKERQPQHFRGGREAVFSCHFSLLQPFLRLPFCAQLGSVLSVERAGCGMERPGFELCSGPQPLRAPCPCSLSLLKP